MDPPTYLRKTKLESTTQAPTPQDTSNLVPAWGQCGGIGYVGNTECVQGYACTYGDQYYHSCQPYNEGDPTPTPFSEEKQYPWQQCGGTDWAGPYVCQDGWYCGNKDGWISCLTLPDGVAAPTFQPTNAPPVIAEDGQCNGVGGEWDLPLECKDNRTSCVWENKTHAFCRLYNKTIYVEEWGQCGGEGWQWYYKHVCLNNTICHATSQWYSHCVSMEVANMNGNSHIGISNLSLTIAIIAIFAVLFIN